MKGRIIVVCLLVTSFSLASAGEVFFGGEEVKLLSDMCIRNNVPDHQTGRLVNLAITYYDYFYGGHSSFSLVKQPSPAGMFEGGGIYHVYTVLTERGLTNRVSYSYILNGVVMSTGFLEVDAPAYISENNPTLAMEYNTGNPCFAWDGWQGNRFSFDHYCAIGFPGLESGFYSVFGEELVVYNPIVKLNSSPLEERKRVYITAAGFDGVRYLAYSDYLDITELSDYNSEDWTVYEIPFTSSLYENGYRLYCDFVVTPTGNVALAGTLHSRVNYQDNKLFVLANRNFGTGAGEEDWTLYETSSLLQVDNPDGYFQGTEVAPRSLHIAPYLPRFTADVDDRGTVIMPMTYRLFIPYGDESYLLRNQGYIKQVKFCFEEEEFTVNDVWPKSANPDAFPYLPWDPEGDDTWEYYHTPEDSFLIVKPSWPVWWWDEEDYEHENYVRISQSGRYRAIVFQERMKARYWYEYNNPDFEGNYGDIYIVASNDYGESWFDPIIMSSNPDDINFEPAFEGMIPAYIYLAEKIEELDNNSFSLHLSFLDHNDYGSSVHENSPLTGGSIYYLHIDVMFPELSTGEDNYQFTRPQISIANYPNPFNPVTTIKFSLPENDRVNLSVYNISGQLVKELIDMKLPKGEHSAVWNGKNINGYEVPSGIYLYRLQTNSYEHTKRMTLIK